MMSYFPGPAFEDAGAFPAIVRVGPVDNTVVARFDVKLYSLRKVIHTLLS